MLIILCNCKSIVFDNCFVFISLLIYLLNCYLLMRIIEKNQMAESETAWQVRCTHPVV